MAEPATIVFDEIYYAQDACWYTRSPAVCGIMGEVVAHPPLGKWPAAGIGIFGHTFGLAARRSNRRTITIAITTSWPDESSVHPGGLLASGFLAIDFFTSFTAGGDADVFVTPSASPRCSAPYDLDTRHDTGAGTLRRP
jgi:hypothetical protein